VIVEGDVVGNSEKEGSVVAKGRTVSADELTDFDSRWLDVAKKLALAFEELIENKDKRREFHSQWSKVSHSRDAEAHKRGGGGGKLQRDALCTRGRTDRSPFSNRNLRWHPLIIAHNTPSWAITVEGILIEDDEIRFVVDGTPYKSSEVFSLMSGQSLGDCLLEPQITTSRPYCAPYSLWSDYAVILHNWDERKWTKNSCAIPAMEYSPAEYCIEVFALLGVAVLDNFYEVDYRRSVEAIMNVFQAIGYKPTCQFNKALNLIEDMLLCPLCKARLNEPPAGIPPKARPSVFQPPWRPPKRKEGAPESTQLFHVEPLIETEIRHTPRLTRYGHRWCNVAMADRSLEETIDFMEAIVKAHRSSCDTAPQQES
jgi:hypothetical protein